MTGHSTVVVACDMFHDRSTRGPIPGGSLFSARHFGPTITPVPWSETLPQVSLAGTLLTVLLLFFAAFGEPILGRRAYAWLARSRDGDARALSLLYAVTMAIHVLWGLLVLVVLMTSSGLVVTDLGLRAPHAFGPVIGGAIGGILALAAMWVLVNGLPSRDRLPLPKKFSPGPPKACAGYRASWPQGGEPTHEAARTRTRGGPAPSRTGIERAMAAGAAVTGGLFGELLYRGLFIVLIIGLGAPLWIAAVLSVLLFAIAQTYQGWWGVANGVLTGTLFTVLYLGTGSLWVPILVHVALNLRSLVFPPASTAPKTGYGHEYHQDDHDDHDEAFDEYDDLDEYDQAHDDGYGEHHDDRGDGGPHGHRHTRVVDHNDGHGGGHGEDPPIDPGPGGRPYDDTWI